MSPIILISLLLAIVGGTVTAVLSWVWGFGFLAIFAFYSFGGSITLLTVIYPVRCILNWLEESAAIDQRRARHP